MAYQAYKYFCEVIFFLCTYSMQGYNFKIVEDSQFVKIVFLYGLPLENIIAKVTYWYMEMTNTAIFS